MALNSEPGRSETTMQAVHEAEPLPGSMLADLLTAAASVTPQYYRHGREIHQRFPGQLQGSVLCWAKRRWQTGRRKVFR